MSETQPVATSRSLLWIVLMPYALVSLLHVVSKYVAPDIEYPTKLMLMPLLALAIVVGVGRGPKVRWVTVLLLLIAVAASWLGDGSGFFFPMFEDELPMMLLSFGIAHLVYMWIFWRAPGIGVVRVPRALLVFYAAIYVVLMWLLAPHTGALMIPVFIYGLVLVGTAILSSTVNTVTAWGGFWFLVSDAVLAFRLFWPDGIPDWAGSVVMITYTLGQGLIVYGVLQRLREHTPTRSRDVPVTSAV